MCRYVPKVFSFLIQKYSVFQYQVSLYKHTIKISFLRYKTCNIEVTIDMQIHFKIHTEQCWLFNLQMIT